MKVSKKLLMLFFFVTTSSTLFSQNNSYKANYLFEEVKDSDLIYKEHYEKLIDVLKDSYSTSNIFSQQTPFIITPSINTLSVQDTGGLGGLKVYKIKTGLVSKMLDLDKTFHAYSKTHIVTSESIDDAISQAIEKTRKDPKIKDFFVMSNQKIFNFYQENCATVINTAKLNISRMEFNKAVGYLQAIPEATTCYPEAEKTITEFYFDSKEQNCKNLVQKATAAESLKNYKTALHYLSYVDPTSKCYQLANDVVIRISNQVNESIVRDFELQKAQFIEKSMLEKLNIINNTIIIEK